MFKQLLSASILALLFSSTCVANNVEGTGEDNSKPSTEMYTLLVYNDDEKTIPTTEMKSNFILACDGHEGHDEEVSYSANMKLLVV